MKRNDNKLKKMLAKIIPKRFKGCDCAATKSGRPCNSFYLDGSHIQDTELLYVCQIARKSLGKPFVSVLSCDSTWQEQVEELIKLAKIKGN